MKKIASKFVVLGSLASFLILAGFIITAPTARAITCDGECEFGTLIVNKVVINDDSGDAIPDDFTFQINGGEPTNFVDGTRELSVLADTYTVTEPSVAGYITTYENCENIEITADSTETCTITNDDQPLIASITIVKETAGDRGSFDFMLSGPDDYLQEFTLTTDDESATDSVTYEVPAGFSETIYSVTETLPENWNLDGVNCEYDGESFGSPIEYGEELGVEAGDEVTCTFYNYSTNRARITLVKETGESFGSFDFEVIGPEGEGQYSDEFTLTTTHDDSSDQVAIEVPANSEGETEYSITELIPENWELDDIVCAYYGEGAGELIYEEDEVVGEDVYLSAGDEVTCTFYNLSTQALLTVIKHVINDDGEISTANQFTIEITNNDTLLSQIEGSETGTTLVLSEGSYTVVEQFNNNYQPYYTGECTGTIEIGQHKVCTITNNDITSDGGGSSGSVADDDSGSVLGESTETPNNEGDVLGALSCSTLSYEQLISIKNGVGADPEIVKALQEWLNSSQDAGLTINGIYDEPTRFAIMLLQEKYADETLSPWGLEKATGNVWQTTARLIIRLVCGVEMPLPNLVPFAL